MKRKILFIIEIILIIILSVLVIYYKIQNTQLLESKNQINYTYITGITEGDTENKDLKSVNWLFGYDENDVCVVSKIVWDYKTEEKAKENYDIWKECENPNIKINGTVVSFDDEAQLGRTKEDMRQNVFGTFEYIVEY